MPHLFAAAVMSAVVLTLAALFGGEPPAPAASIATSCVEVW